MLWFPRRTPQRKKTNKSARQANRLVKTLRADFEPLELRLALSTLTWTGAVDGNWSTNNSGSTNWSSNLLPSSGDTLIFPAGAPHLANTDDISNLTVNSISFTGASGGYNIGGTNQLTISSGITASNTAGTNTLNLPIVLGATQSFNVGSGAQLNVGGVVSGTNGLLKDGAGTLDLLAADTYNGGTTVDAGSLLVDGTIGSVTLNGGTVGGTGTVGVVTTTAGGTLSPGGTNTPGVLSSGAVTLNNLTTFNALLDGTTAGNGPSNYSQLKAGGAVNLAGATLSATLGFPLTTNASFTLIQATGTITGTFAQGNSIVLSGQKFVIAYNTNSVVLTAANTTSTLVSSANPATLNQPVTFTDTVAPVSGVTGTPTGTVNFFDGSTLLGPGTLATVNGQQQATFSTSTLAIGSHSITAVYAGDSNFNGSTSSVLTQQITTIGTTTTLTAPLNAIAYGTPITLTAVVNKPSGVGTPTGTVSFFDGTTQIGLATLTTVNGQQQASITTSSLNFGNRSLTAVYSGDVNFTTSTSSPIAMLVGNTTQRYVDQLYRDLLGRDVDPQGAVYWSSLLFSGVSPTTVVQSIMGSAEYRTVEIQSIFQQYLGRAADAPSLASFGQYLSTGGTIAGAKAILLGSNEYYQLHGSSSSGFGGALYHDLLGRSIDSGAQAAINAELAAGVSRMTVAAQIMSTTEYRQDLVQSFYLRYLNRPADSVGLNYNVGRLAAGASEESIVAGLLASAEYYNRIGP
jgi:hypothetical protein